jgi:hypothetical protein
MKLGKYRAHPRRRHDWGEDIDEGVLPSALNEIFRRTSGPLYETFDEPDLRSFRCIIKIDYIDASKTLSLVSPDNNAAEILVGTIKD